MAITLQQANENLDAWVAASKAIAAGKEHEVNGRRVRFEDGAEVREQIAFWEGKVRQLTVAASSAPGTSDYSVSVFMND